MKQLRTKNLLFFALILICINIKSQQILADSVTLTPDLFSYNDSSDFKIDEMPQFLGGIDEMYHFINKKIKYPELAFENGVTGIVNVQFDIDKDGSLSDVIVINKVDKSLAKEVIRVVKLMPKWLPGKHKGEYVKFRMMIPIKFDIEKRNTKKNHKPS